MLRLLYTKFASELSSELQENKVYLVEHNMNEKVRSRDTMVQIRKQPMTRPHHYSIPNHV